MAFLFTVLEIYETNMQIFWEFIMWEWFQTVLHNDD